jgi:hypothetical protein
MGVKLGLSPRVKTLIGGVWKQDTGKIGPKIEDVQGRWKKKKQHDEELHNLYSSPNIIKLITLRMRCVG